MLATVSAQRGFHIGAIAERETTDLLSIEQDMFAYDLRLYTNRTQKSQKSRSG
jgi:hypothetical protein